MNKNKKTKKRKHLKTRVQGMHGLKKKKYFVHSSDADCLIQSMFS